MLSVLKKLNLDQKPLKMLIIFLATDLFFIVMHVISKVARWFDLGTTIRDDQFNIYYDLTLGESFQYVKEYWMILFFAWLIFRHKQYFYTGWAFLLVYFLLTDMLSIHNNLATFTLERMNIDPFYVLYGALRYQDFGELAVSMVFGMLIFPMIAISYFRGGRNVRTIFHYLIGMLLIIVFFGVVNDSLNRVFDQETNKILYEITRLIEDGGEMIGMSIMCWYVFTLTEPEPAHTEV
jgi:hypothetical protein